MESTRKPEKSHLSGISVMPKYGNQTSTVNGINGQIILKRMGKRKHFRDAHKHTQLFVEHLPCSQGWLEGIALG